MEYVIRSATLDDRVMWADLRMQLWPHCSASRHQTEIDQLLAGAALVAVACCDGKLIGFAEMSIRADHVEGTARVPVPYLEGWYVAKAYRGRGAGRALLAFVERAAVGRGYSEMASDAEIDNELSIRLHKELGFREVGRSVHFVKPLTASLPNQSSDPTLASGTSPAGQESRLL